MYCYRWGGWQGDDLRVIIDTERRLSQFNIPLVREAHVGAMSLVVIYSIWFDYIARQLRQEKGSLTCSSFLYLPSPRLQRLKSQKIILRKSKIFVSWLVTNIVLSQILDFLVLWGQPMGFFPTAERGLDGFSLPFHLYSYYKLCYLLSFLC